MGKKAPPLAGWRLDGKGLLSLDDLRKPAPSEGGAQPARASAVVVSFFATWCAPCRAGLPVLEKAVQRRVDRGVRGLLVAAGERGAGPRTMLEQLGVRLLAISDRFLGLAKRWGVVVDGAAVLPRTFLVDADGVVRVIWTEEGEGFEAALNAALDDLVGAGNPDGG